MIRTQGVKSQTVGCYYQGSEELLQEAIFGEGEALQHSAMPLRHAHQDGAAREGDRLRGTRGRPEQQERRVLERKSLWEGPGAERERDFALRIEHSQRVSG